MRQHLHIPYYYFQRLQLSMYTNAGVPDLAAEGSGICKWILIIQEKRLHGLVQFAGICPCELVKLAACIASDC